MPPHNEIDRAFAHFRQNSSPRELAAVYDALAPELLRLALHLTGRASDAEDVLQATFVTAIERAASYDPARRVLPWMTGILANEARELRRRRGLPPDPERLEQRTQPSPDATAEARELDESLLRALERVPEAFRAVLRLAFLHGLSTSEIAAALDRPDGTVRSQLAPGTEHLRRLLPLGLAGLAGACTTRAASLAAIRARVLAHPALSNTPY
ncbi:MAG: sigma-70 family RNA polymerase sigma factor, partial [Planctomycetota bacterium]